MVDTSTNRVGATVGAVGARVGWGVGKVGAEVGTRVGVL